MSDELRSYIPIMEEHGWLVEELKDDTILAYSDEGLCLEVSNVSTIVNGRIFSVYSKFGLLIPTVLEATEMFA